MSLPPIGGGSQSWNQPEEIRHEIKELAQQVPGLLAAINRKLQGVNVNQLSDEELSQLQEEITSAIHEKLPYSLRLSPGLSHLLKQLQNPTSFKDTVTRLQPQLASSLMAEFFSEEEQANQEVAGGAESHYLTTTEAAVHISQPSQPTLTPQGGATGAASDPAMQDLYQDLKNNVTNPPGNFTPSQWSDLHSWFVQAEGLTTNFTTAMKATLASFTKDWQTNPPDVPQMLASHNKTLRDMARSDDSQITNNAKGANFQGLLNQYLGGMLSSSPEPIKFEGESFSREDFANFIKGQSEFKGILTIPTTDPTCPPRDIEPIPPKSGTIPNSDCATLDFNNNSTIDSSEVYILVMGTDPQTKKECYVYYDSSGNPSYQDVSYTPFTPSEKYSVPLSKLPGGVLKLPPMISGRIYTSYGAPLSCNITPTAGDPTHGTINPPRPEDSTDPNFGTLYGKMEFSNGLDNGTRTLWINPTSVDDYDVPLSLDMPGSVSAFKKVGIDEPNSQVMAKLKGELQNAPGDWSKLIQDQDGATMRIISPGKADPSLKLIPDDYLVNLQSYLSTHNFYIKEEGLPTDYYSSYDAFSHMLTFNPVDPTKGKAIYVPIDASNINQSTIFGATVQEEVNGSRVTPDSKDPAGNLLRDFGAGMEANVLPTTAMSPPPTGLPQGSYYALNKYYFKSADKYTDQNSGFPADCQLVDYYSKAIHGLGFPDYSYAYDDELGQDGTLQGVMPAVTTVTLGDVSFPQGQSPLDGVVDNLQKWEISYGSSYPGILSLADHLIDEAKTLLAQTPPGTITDLQKYVNTEFIQGKDIYADFPGLTDGSLDPNISSADKQHGNLLGLLGMTSSSAIPIPRGSEVDEAHWRLLDFPWSTPAAKQAVQDLLGHFTSWDAKSPTLLDLAEYATSHIFTETGTEGMSTVEIRELSQTTTATNKNLLGAAMDELQAWVVRHRNDQYMSLTPLAAAMIAEINGLIAGQPPGTLDDLQKWMSDTYLSKGDIYSTFRGLTDGSDSEDEGGNLLGLIGLSSSGTYPIPTATDVDRAIWELHDYKWASDGGKAAASSLLDHIPNPPGNMTLQDLAKWAKDHITPSTMDRKDWEEIQTILGGSDVSPLQKIENEVKAWEQGKTSEEQRLGNDVITEIETLKTEGKGVDDLKTWFEDKNDKTSPSGKSAQNDLYYGYPGLTQADLSSLVGYIPTTCPPAQSFDKKIADIARASLQTDSAVKIQNKLIAYIQSQPPSTGVAALTAWTNANIFTGPDFWTNYPDITPDEVQTIATITGGTVPEKGLAGIAAAVRAWDQFSPGSKQDELAQDILKEIQSLGTSGTKEQLWDWLEDQVAHKPQGDIYYGYPGLTQDNATSLYAALDYTRKPVPQAQPYDQIIANLANAPFSSPQGQALQQKIITQIQSMDPTTGTVPTLAAWVNTNIFTNSFWNDNKGISPVDAQTIASTIQGTDFPRLIPPVPASNKSLQDYLNEIDGDLSERKEVEKVLGMSPTNPYGWTQAKGRAQKLLPTMNSALTSCQAGDCNYLADLLHMSRNTPHDQLLKAAEGVIVDLKALIANPTAWGLGTQSAIALFTAAEAKVKDEIASNGTVADFQAWVKSVINGGYSGYPNLTDADKAAFSALQQ